MTDTPANRTPADGPALSPWLLWQIIDSAFPTGGFAHSGGLEAAWQNGLVTTPTDVARWARMAVIQAAAGAVPVMLAVLRDESLLEAADALYDASCWNHVASRASRSQGRAMLSSAVGATTHRSGQGPHPGRGDRLKHAAEAAAAGRWKTHLPAVFGLIAAWLGVDDRTAARAFLFVTARGFLSAGVRLGVLGPMESQRMLAASGNEAEQLISAACDADWRSIAQPAPLLDVLQGTQDRLYSRLFQS